MPITPRFSLSQTPFSILITIKIPHIRVSTSTIECIITDSTTFHFYSSPYLLILNFSHSLVSDEDAELAKIEGRYDDEVKKSGPRATYDPNKDNGTIVVTIDKVEDFMWDDLDLMGKVTYPSSSLFDVKKNGGITVLSSTTTNNGNDDEENAQQQQHKQSLLSSLKPHYGFCNQYHSIFSPLQHDGLLSEILEIPNPDSNETQQKEEEKRGMREERIQVENEKFDIERYLVDEFTFRDFCTLNTANNGMEKENCSSGDALFDEAIQFTPHWYDNENSSSSAKIKNINDADDEHSIENLTERMSSLKTTLITATSTSSYFSEEEHLLLNTIQSRTLYTPPSSEQQSHSLLLNLLDVLFSYAYEHRLTCGEPTIESTHCIIYNSPTLSWLESYDSSIHHDSVQNVLKSCIRRMLIYPYIRSYKFATSIVLSSDLIQMFEGGKKVLLKSLLQIHNILETKNDCHGYLHNKIWIDPLILWVVNDLEEDVLESFTRKLTSLVEKEKGKDDGILGKGELDLDLISFEEEAFGEGTEEEDEEESDDDESNVSGEKSSSEEDSSDEHSEEDDDTLSYSDNSCNDDTKHKNENDRKNNLDMVAVKTTKINIKSNVDHTAKVAEEERTKNTKNETLSSLSHSGELLDDIVGNSTDDNQDRIGGKTQAVSILLKNDRDISKDSESTEEQQTEKSTANQKKKLLIQEIG